MPTNIPWFTAQDVINRWTGDAPPAVDDVLLLTLVEDATTLIKFKFPTLQKRVDAGFDVNLIKIVGSAVVQRAYVHEPTRKSSYSYTSGPFSESGSYGDGAGEDGLFLTDSEISMLRPAGVSSNAFSINLDRNARNGLYPYGVYEGWGTYGVYGWRG